ncbi:MAG: hypothetical protein HC910_17215 [Spirulinaceae cyanobacterium SM2_1_0]|nr:hypothetical protein [Spirulinaceae cyanobacterium SM2_1_0]
MSKRWFWAALLVIVPLAIARPNWAQADARNDYRLIEPDEFRQIFGAASIEPRALAHDLFSAFAGDSEGRRSESLEITYPEPGQAVVTVEIIGLSDDSIAGSRYRVELQYNDGSWQVVWVGTQTQCWPGRGHQNWSSALCS